MDKRNTINSILAEMYSNLPIISEGNYIETIKTFYPDYKKHETVTLNGIKMTKPLCSSEETKKVFIKENSPLLEVYKETSRGDILLVKKNGANRIVVENLSVKEEFRKEFEIEKLDVIKGNFNIIKRKSCEMYKVFESIK